MNKWLIAATIIVVLIIAFVLYRKFIYVPELKLELKPDYQAKSVRYFVYENGKNVVEGVSKLSDQTYSQLDYAKWNLSIGKYASMTMEPYGLGFEIKAKGKTITKKMVNFKSNKIEDF